MTDNAQIVDEAVATMANAAQRIVRLRATVSILCSTLEAAREHVSDKRTLALIDEALEAAKLVP